MPTIGAFFSSPLHSSHRGFGLDAGGENTACTVPSNSPNPLCEECSGELRNAPIVGMKILRRLRWDGEQYSGGEILDPDDGKVYRCRVRLVDGGRKLEVHGFVGVPLLGRTQTWLRAD